MDTVTVWLVVAYVSGVFGSFVFGIGFSQVGRFLQKSGGMAMRRSQA